MSLNGKFPFSQVTDLCLHLGMVQFLIARSFFFFFLSSVFLGPFKNQHLLKILRAQGGKKIHSLYYSCSRRSPKALFCDSVNNCLIHVKQAARHAHSVEKTAACVLWPSKTTQKPPGCAVTAPWHCCGTTRMGRSHVRCTTDCSMRGCRA